MGSSLTRQMIYRTCGKWPWDALNILFILFFVLYGCPSWLNRDESFCQSVWHWPVNNIVFTRFANESVIYSEPIIKTVKMTLWQFYFVDELGIQRSPYYNMIWCDKGEIRKLITLGNWAIAQYMYEDCEL